MMDNLRNCPVCSHNYQVEGEYVPCMLICLHTACKGCILGKLYKSGDLECPECGTKHPVESGMKNIRKNEYIISHITKMVERSSLKKNQTEGLEKECEKHGKVQSIFCNESTCQMPICLMCLKDDHKTHDFSDLQEVAKERCAAVLEDVQSMQKTLLKEKEDFLAVQKIVAQNCQECTVEIRGMKEDLINEIDRRASSLIYDINEHQKKVDANVKKVVMNIDEKLDIVKDLEENINTASVFDVKPEKLEKVKLAKNQIQSKISETINYTALTYKKCGDVPKYLSLLCGKVTHKNEGIRSEMLQNLTKCVLQETDCNDNNKVIKEEDKILSTSSSLQENTTSRLPAMKTTVDSKENNRITNSPSMENISTDEAAGKKEENMHPEISSGGSLKRASGLMAEESPFQSSVETATESPSSTITAATQEGDGVINIEPVSDIQCIQPTNNTSSFVQLTNDVARSNSNTAEEVVEHTHTAEATVVNNHPVEGGTSIPHHLITKSTGTIQPTVNAEVNKQPDESKTLLNQSAINNTQTTEPAADEVNSRGNEDSRKRASRSRLHDDVRDDNDIESGAKKARLESLEEEDSQTKNQRPWQGKEQQKLFWEVSCLFT